MARHGLSVQKGFSQSSEKGHPILNSESGARSLHSRS